MREIVKKIRNKAADVWRKVLLPALLATFYMLSTTGTVAFAAGDTSAVTKPLENLKTLVIAVIGAIGIIILAKNVMDVRNPCFSMGLAYPAAGFFHDELGIEGDRGRCDDGGDFFRADILRVLIKCKEQGL